MTWEEWHDPRDVIRRVLDNFVSADYLENEIYEALRRDYSFRTCSTYWGENTAHGRDLEGNPLGAHSCGRQLGHEGRHTCSRWRCHSWRVQGFFRWEAS